MLDRTQEPVNITHMNQMNTTFPRPTANDTTVGFLRDLSDLLRKNRAMISVVANPHRDEIEITIMRNGGMSSVTLPDTFDENEVNNLIDLLDQ